MLISETHNKDCMIDLINYPDNYFYCAIVDPEFGIGETSISSKSRNTPVKQKNGGVIKIKDKNYSSSNWDASRPDAEYFFHLDRVSQFQIIKGGNYFTDLLPTFSAGRFIWDKVNVTNDFSDCEIFWTNIIKSTRMFAYMWSGMMQGESLLEPRKPQGNKKLNEKRIHRCQTPVKVFDWIYKGYIPKGSRILDTHMGSGSNRISAYKHQCDYVGYEIGMMGKLTVFKKVKTEKIHLVKKEIDGSH